MDDSNKFNDAAKINCKALPKRAQNQNFCKRSLRSSQRPFETLELLPLNRCEKFKAAVSKRQRNTDGLFQSKVPKTKKPTVFKTIKYARKPAYASKYSLRSTINIQTAGPALAATRGTKHVIRKKQNVSTTVEADEQDSDLDDPHLEQACHELELHTTSLVESEETSVFPSAEDSDRLQETQRQEVLQQTPNEPPPDSVLHHMGSSGSIDKGQFQELKVVHQKAVEEPEKLPETISRKDVLIPSNSQDQESTSEPIVQVSIEPKMPAQLESASTLFVNEKLSNLRSVKLKEKNILKAAVLSQVSKDNENIRTLAPRVKPKSADQDALDHLRDKTMSSRTFEHNSSTHGRGIFTSKDVKKGNFLLEYFGEIISRKDGLQREEVYKRQGKGNYMLFFTFDSHRYCADGTNTHHGARWVNHSCKKDIINAKLRSASVSGKVRVFLQATKDIPQGREVFYNYGEDRKHVLNDPDFKWLHT